MLELNKYELAKRLITKTEGLLLIDFYQDNCRPCSLMNPILEELNRGAVPIVKINVSVVPEFIEDYQLMSTPTFILFENGVERDRKSGYVPFEVMEAFITV